MYLKKADWFGRNEVFMEILQKILMIMTAAVVAGSMSVNGMLGPPAQVVAPLAGAYYAGAVPPPHMSLIAGLVPPADIDVFDASTLTAVSTQIFPVGAFGANVGGNLPVAAVIAEMEALFNSAYPNDGRIGGHIALARVVFETNNVAGNNSRNYVYPIPYVFVSGINGASAIVRWQNYFLWVGLGLGFAQNLFNAIYDVSLPRPIYTRLKGIGDYLFLCLLDGQNQFYSHTERSAILCLLYDIANSLEDAAIALAGQIAPGNAVQNIVVQIKIAANYVCQHCQNFLNGRAFVFPMNIFPNPQYPFPNVAQNRVNRPPGQPVLFNSQAQGGGTIFATIAHLQTKSTWAVPIHLRISWITPLAVPGAPPPPIGGPLLVGY
ncbi:MAG: hypothetical protein LBP41_00635 [Holosporaceae bacterium]|jgi:hypothetical protein|nr:hypothetical protein [Holosporaceae bacterium]